MNSILHHLSYYEHVWLFGFILVYIIYNALKIFIIPSRRLE
jgi:hypothetical protein